MWEFASFRKMISHSPTSSRSLPAESVLLKLKENNSRSSREGPPPFHRCNTMVTADNTYQPMRKRCFSEIRPRNNDLGAQQKTKSATKALAIPPPFALGESIARSAERLERLHQELSGIHANLDGHVNNRKRQLSMINQAGKSGDSGCCVDSPSEDRCPCSASVDSSGSYTGSFFAEEMLGSPLSEEEIEEEVASRSGESCRGAVRDLEAADAAWQEFRLVLSEVGAAVRCEERHMCGRATVLDRQGRENFEKMSRRAVDKHKLTRQCAEEEEEEGEGEEQQEEEYY